MLLLVYHKHTQWAGPGRTNDNVVGYPLLPVYAAKAGGFFFIVFGVTALDGRAAADQPDLDVRALQPVEGDRRLAARLVHGLARGRSAHHAAAGRPTSGASRSRWNVMVPGLVLMGLLFTVLGRLPVHRGVDHR